MLYWTERATAQIEDLFIRLQALQDRSLTATVFPILMHHTHEVCESDCVISSRLQVIGLNSCKPLEIYVPSRGNLARRLLWTQENGKGLRNNWDPIM